MNRRRADRIGATALVVAALFAPAAAAGSPILLPSVRTTLTPGPPVIGTAPAPAEVLYPPGMASDQRVLVGVGARGRPMSVQVVQRLVLHRIGDYSFAVPGPIADVEAAEGSDSEPGLRKDAILWSGFSSGKRTLAARATLRIAAVAPVLPLRLSVTREGGALVLRGENATGAPAPLLVGPVNAGDAARALDDTRRNLYLGRAAPDIYATVPRTPFSQSDRIVAPLDVRGDVGGAKFAYRLGDGDPLRFERRFQHAAAGAKLHVVVTPISPSHLLAPSHAKSWKEALRRGRLDKGDLLRQVSIARLTVARALQYRAFLANPNPTGRSTAVYVYDTVKRAAAPSTMPSRDNGSSDAWQAVLFTTLAIVGAGALVVVWAHS